MVKKSHAILTTWLRGKKMSTKMTFADMAQISEKTETDPMHGPELPPEGVSQPESEHPPYKFTQEMGGTVSFFGYDAYLWQGNVHVSPAQGEPAKCVEFSQVSLMEVAITEQFEAIGSQRLGDIQQIKVTPQQGGMLYINEVLPEEQIKGTPKIYTRSVTFENVSIHIPGVGKLKFDIIVTPEVSDITLADQNGTVIEPPFNGSRSDTVAGG